MKRIVFLAFSLPNAYRLVRKNDQTLLPHQRLGALRPGPAAIHPFHITHQAVRGRRGPQATYGGNG